METISTDVLVVGGGNAGLCAALAAKEAGADVVVMEGAPRDERGGNSTFTGGLFRAPYRGLDDLQRVMPDMSESEIESADFGSYPREAFFEDLARMSDYRADPDLLETFVDGALDGLEWMGRHGIRFLPPFGRRSYRRDGKDVFVPGAVIEASGGGWGLVEMLYEAVDRAAIEVRYGARLRELRFDDDGRVAGALARSADGLVAVDAGATVLATGGFQSNAAWRAAYLGPGWDLARCRGTSHNTGKGIEVAMAAGGSSAGAWSNAHATPWEFNAPEFGDIRAARRFFRAQYPYGIMVNANGRRFVDEGADFHNYTYAKYGRAVLEQPGHFAWQVYDAVGGAVLGKEEYRSGGATRVTADSLEALADQLEGVDREGFLATVAAYNAAVDESVSFDPAVKDGKAARGVEPAKSNWATPISEPPFEAFQVTCGITYTFGGVRIDPSSAAVVDGSGVPVPGLFAAGEMVGALFYANYPAGSGLTAGTVFGRLAGRSGASRVAGVRT